MKRLVCAFKTKEIAQVPIASLFQGYLLLGRMRRDFEWIPFVFSGSSSVIVIAAVLVSVQYS